MAKIPTQTDSSSFKKLSTLFLLKVLKEYSDEYHPLTQKQIAEHIERLSGIEIRDMETIKNNLDYLGDFGIEIKKAVGKRGVYLNSRDFEPSEINFLVDALFSSKSLNSKQARDLAEKLYSTLSTYQRRKFKYMYKADEIYRTNNKELFYTIDILNEAIEKGKQVKFKYKRFNFDATSQQKQNAKEYIINPYYMINSQGRYYLVCNLDYYDDIANYKIDLISNIELLDTPIKKITKIKNYEKGFDIAKYANENIYMFGGNNVTATLKLEKEYAENYVNEWFGNKVRFYKKDDSTYVDVTANENALVYWALQYGEVVELISPNSTRERIKTIVNNMTKKYK